MRIIDQTIILALQAAIRASGSTFAFSRKIGVAHSTVIFWLNGRTRHIRTALWQERLYPLLEKSLLAQLPGVTEYRLRKMYFEQCPELFAQKSVLSVPVLEENEFLQYDAHIESLDHFARNSTTQTLFHGFSSESYYALHLNTENRFFPDVLVFLSPLEEPEYGSVVCCKFSDSRKILLCVFEKNESMIRLSPLGREREPLEWDFHKNPNMLDWLFPTFGLRLYGRVPDFMKEGNL